MAIGKSKILQKLTERPEPQRFLRYNRIVMVSATIYCENFFKKILLKIVQSKAVFCSCGQAGRVATKSVEFWEFGEDVGHIDAFYVAFYRNIIQNVQNNRKNKT